MRRLGLYGGRFDPPHLGHLLVAEHALEHYALDEVWFIPAQNPPHKEAQMSAEHRVNMTVLATASHPRFKVSALELARGGPSYAFDTVQEVKRLQPGAQVYFITGIDAYYHIHTWHRALELVNLIQMIAVSRPGYTLDGVGAPYRDKVLLLEGLAVDVSSSDIRKRLASGRSIRYLVPELVENYLDKHHLYRH